MKYQAISGSGTNVSKNIDYYMRSDDIPALFSYLTANGYVIDTNITHMMTRSKLLEGTSDVRISGNRKLICMVSYIA